MATPGLRLPPLDDCIGAAAGAYTRPLSHEPELCLSLILYETTQCMRKEC
jgi:hypothetical protein